MSSEITLPDSRVLSYSLDSTPKDGPVVLLGNSLCAPFRLWDHVVPVLNARGFRTLRYDQPGHGASSAPKSLDATMDSMAVDVHSLLQNLGISRLHSWVGVSMGAAIGIYFVTRYPGVVGNLVICDTISSSPVNMGLDDVFKPRVEAARHAGNMEGITQGTMERWFGREWLERNPEEAKRLRGIMLGTTVDGFETCCHALRSPSFDLRPLFAKVGSSVERALCVVGEKDANLPQTMADMRDKIQAGFSAAGKDNKIDLVVIKAAGHVCFIDGFDRFCKTITLFISDDKI